MKKLLALSALLASASIANAGALAYIAPESTMIEEAGTMGGSGAWIIPLVILGLLVLGLSAPAPTSPEPCPEEQGGSVIAQC